MGRTDLSRIIKGKDFFDQTPIAGHHIYASMPASTGQVDLYTLQKLLTHKSPTMTQRYAHPRDQAFRQAADLAGNIIEQVSNGSMTRGFCG